MLFLLFSLWVLLSHRTFMIVNNGEMTQGIRNKFYSLPQAVIGALNSSTIVLSTWVVLLSNTKLYLWWIVVDSVQERIPSPILFRRLLIFAVCERRSFTEPGHSVLNTKWKLHFHWTTMAVGIIRFYMKISKKMPLASKDDLSVTFDFLYKCWQA